MPGKWEGKRPSKKELGKILDDHRAWLEWLSGQKMVIGNIWATYFEKSDFSRADLSNADLSIEDLSSVDLTMANLSEANLSGTHLFYANLAEANLSGASLSQAELSGANLTMANLTKANLTGADLTSADMSKAIVGYVNFSDIDLSKVIGLHKVNFVGPSTIGIDTIYKSSGKIPESFLRGCGVPDGMIEFAHSLDSMIIKFYSAFISYSTEDQGFADRIYNDFQGRGVRCWLSSEDLIAGRDIMDTVFTQIRVKDKVVIILSPESIQSAWVEDEVKRATQQERDQNRRDVIIPVMLDSTVLKSKIPWVERLKDRLILDFEGWDKDNGFYQKQFEKLLKALNPEFDEEE